MSSPSKAADISQRISNRSRVTPQGISLIIMWFLSTITLITMLANGVRFTDQFDLDRRVLQVFYVVVLLWYLLRGHIRASQLPGPAAVAASVGQRSARGAIIPALVIALLFAAVLMIDDGLVFLLLGMIIATIWLIIAWRQEVHLRPLVLGLALAGVALLGGLLFLINNFVGNVLYYSFPLFVPLMFIAGGLLFKRTGLGKSQIYSEHYLKALGSFLWGCLLFIPLGLFNAADGSPGGNIDWVSGWWMPLVTPWWSAIAEETWFRLLLIPFCYYLLQPLFVRRPVLAVVVPVLFSAITFGLGHDGSFWDRFLVTGMLYGLPLSVIFVRQDFEHAVGAHYMINMIPMVTVYLAIG